MTFRFTHRVFIDISAFLALLVERDTNHVAAIRIAGRMAQEGRRPYTTNLVVAEARAPDIIRCHKDKKFSFTDATSFAVVERLVIEAAFSFDSDFRQYGLPLMKP